MIKYIFFLDHTIQSRLNLDYFSLTTLNRYSHGTHSLASPHVQLDDCAQNNPFPGRRDLCESLQQQTHYRRHSAMIKWSKWIHLRRRVDLLLQFSAFIAAFRRSARQGTKCKYAKPSQNGPQSQPTRNV